MYSILYRDAEHYCGWKSFHM